jgi:uncharacterized protein YbgA (DUF1722 family)
MRPRIAVSTGAERRPSALDPYVEWVRLETEGTLQQVDGWILPDNLHDRREDCRGGSAVPCAPFSPRQSSRPQPRMSGGQAQVAPPLLPVEDEDGLVEVGAREHFIERVFGHAELRALFSAEWRPGDLVDFHARHKLQIMAHDPARYREIGRLVAAAGTLPRGEISDEYRRLFMSALAQLPGPGRHTNALQHMFGYFSGKLDDTRRRDVAGVIDAYQRGEVPLAVPMALVRHHVEAEGIGYLSTQTYFEPFPAGLRGQRPS